jgi:hypothetical protein
MGYEALVGSACRILQEEYDNVGSFRVDEHDGNVDADYSEKCCNLDLSVKNLRSNLRLSLDGRHQLPQEVPTDNASMSADAVVNTVFINGSQGYLESYSQFSDLCRCQEFRLSNPFYPQTGSGDSFVEKFRRSMKFTLTSAKIDSILGYAESVKKNPGTYNVASNNCLMFVTHAFAAAGFLFVAQSGDELTDLANAPALWFQSIYGIKTSGGKISKYSNIDDFYD